VHRSPSSCSSVPRAALLGICLFASSVVIVLEQAAVQFGYTRLAATGKLFVRMSTEKSMEAKQKRITLVEGRTTRPGHVSYSRGAESRKSERSARLT
jgi:hypothetical protein